MNAVRGIPNRFIRILFPAPILIRGDADRNRCDAFALELE